MIRSLIVFLGISFSAQAVAQQMHFAILLFGDSVGYMHLQRTRPTDTTEYYVLNTVVRAKVLFIDRQVESRYEVTYTKGRLTESHSWENSNGQRKHWADVRYVNGLYKVESEKGARTFSEVPYWSIVKVFMQQPTDGQRVLYEGCGAIGTMKQVGPATFQYKSCDGNTNNYTYKQQSMHSVEFDVGLVTLRMRRCY